MRNAGYVSLYRGLIEVRAGEDIFGSDLESRELTREVMRWREE